MSLQKKIYISLLLILAFLFFDTTAAFAHAPHDDIQQLEISPIYDQDKTLFVVIRSNLLKSVDGGHSWNRIVKGLDNKHEISSLDITYSHRNKVLFLSSDGDGIYKSQDEGSSWIKVNNRLNSLNISLLSISPNYYSDKVVLAAGVKKGLYKTENGGESWYQIMDSDNKITVIYSLPGKRDNILVGDDKGRILQLSTGGSNVWRQRFQILNSGAITAIAVSPNFPLDNTFFVGTEKGGIFKTVNGGTSFSKVNNSISDKSISSIVISPSHRNGFTIFSSTRHEAVFCSNDGGNTWRKYDEGIAFDRQADKQKKPYYKYLRISKTFEKDKTIFLGGFDGLFKSTNGGRDWEQMNTLSSNLIISSALSPEYNNDSTVAITTYLGGTYLTNDQGTTWKAINKGLKEARIGKGLARLGDIVFSPNYRLDNTIFIALDNALLRSTDKGNHWDKFTLSNEYGGLNKLVDAVHYRSSQWIPKDLDTFLMSRLTRFWPTTIAISPSFVFDNIVYLGTREGAILRSVDRGENSFPVGNGIGQKIRCLVISPDFSSDKTLYLSVAKEVYKTINGGETWQLVSNGLAFANDTKEARIQLVISPQYKVDKTVFASTVEGLFRTTDRGKTWVKIASSTYDKDGYIDAISISPSYQNDHTLVINVKGKGLFKTTNGGETFVQVGTDLINSNHSLSNMNNFPPTSAPIKFSSTYSIDNTIYGSSAEELFVSTDGGNTWKIVLRPQVEFKHSRKHPVVLASTLFVTIPIFRLLCASIASFCSYLFLGFLRLERKLPFSKFQIKICSAFTVFIAVFILWPLVVL